MAITTILVLCSFTVGTTHSMVTLEADVPFVSRRLSDDAKLECCYTTTVNAMKSTLIWVRSLKVNGKTSGPFSVILSKNATMGEETKAGSQCGTLTLKSVQLSDTGLYQCWFNTTNIISYGTYLLVYKPLEKTIDLSESTKNKILTAEGFLLLLCMILPSATLLFKSKKLKELEKKKVEKEEENIYQGLNLDDCCAIYDQMERSQAPGPYQDVCNFVEQEEEIQLEKP